LPALRVLGEPLNIALPRLLLFSSAKKILGEGMQLIGIKPIEKI
jgi:arginyl-tRNA synthetase